MFCLRPALRHWATLSLILFLGAAPTTAQALDINVSKTGDSLDGICDSDCSLREAIVLANQTPGAHRIRLLAGTYNLNRPARQSTAGKVFGEDQNIDGDLDIRSELVISGAGLARTSINANRNDRVLDIFEDARVTLSGLTLTGGHHSDEGGAIRNHGELSLKDVRLRDNQVLMTREDFTVEGRGGAIANYGRLNLLRCNFLYNLISLQSKKNGGGALYNVGVLSMRDSDMRASTVGSGYENHGGAIFNTGTADIARSLFISNFALDGGSGLMNHGVMKLTNSTVAGSLGDYSTAISNGLSATTPIPELRLVNVTVTENSNYGLGNAGKLVIRNSIIINNRARRRNEFANCSSHGANQSVEIRGLLVGVNNCGSEQVIDDRLALTTIFYPLASNNAALETYALRPNSPAVDAGEGSCTSHDQRGSSRPRDGNGDGIAACDLGAYERPKP